MSRLNELGEIIVGRGRLSWQEQQDITEVVCLNLCKHVDEYDDVNELHYFCCAICPLAEKLEDFSDE